MVGRRGISKGCLRCRQRKKGCDMRRPACGQCMQQGSTCPGYGAGMTFVHDSRSVGPGKTALLGGKEHRLGQVGTPSSLIRSAGQVGLTDHFWYLFLPRKYTSPQSHHGSLDEFFQAVEHLSSSETVARHAFWALSCLVVGHEVCDSQLLRQSSKMYDQALKELHTTVEKVQKLSLPSSAEMAMTCNLLALYEVFDDPSQTRFGFFTHSQGLAELVRLRGPNGFRSGVAWAAFQGVRVAIIISAIQRRRATFLSSEEWCTIPWHPQSKPAWQRVIDVMAQVPELLEQFDQLVRIKRHEERRIHGVRLLNHCWMLDSALQAWYYKLPSLFGLAPSAQLSQTKKSSRPDSPFSIEVYFEDQVHGQAMIFYWTTCVFVYGVMQNLAQIDPTLSSPYTAVSTRTDPYHYAACIVQSTLYFLQPSVGLLMRKIFAFPLATAYAYLATFPSGSTATYVPGTSPSYTSLVSGWSNFFDSAGSSESLPAPQVGDVETSLLRTYLESTAKSMHIYVAHMNVFCNSVSQNHKPPPKDGD